MEDSYEIFKVKIKNLVKRLRKYEAHRERGYRVGRRYTENK